MATADNRMRVMINGRKVKDNGMTFFDWAAIGRENITDFLTRGQNTLAIAVTNEGSQANPAGLLGKFIISFQDGRRLEVLIDSSWKTVD